MTPNEYRAARARYNRLTNRVSRLREQLLITLDEQRATQRQVIQYETEKRERKNDSHNDSKEEAT